jgi:serine/threonine protein kinase/tetratricopeptide (TPR) repeat protein
MSHDMKGESGDPGEQPSKEAGLTLREIRTCPVCGTKFTATGDAGLCPVCILRGAVRDESELAQVLSPASESERISAEPELLSVVCRFENYEVMLGENGIPIELGRGAMGITYKAFDVDLRFSVALKVINERYVGNESARLRFLREARAAAKVRHSNVASVFHLGRSGQDYFYAMEYVEGETLESLIKRYGRLEVKLALEIASQVAAGLAAVHEQNLVHRDIKPTNIMVALKGDGRATAKIIDLGLAKVVSEGISEAAISTPGVFAGTPEFASPEQFVGVGVDIRSDLYSLGVALWEMLSGHAPFRGSPAHVMYQHQHAPLPLERLKGVPQPAVALLEVLLQKKPAQRFQSPAELLSALSRVADAIRAGHTITHQSLRGTAEQVLAAPEKGTGVLARLRAALAIRTVQLILLPVLALLIAGGVVRLVSVLIENSHQITITSNASSGTIKAPEKSIAVLPFESLSENKSDTYFADGVQDEILNNLAKIAQLKVISRTSVMQYRADNKRDLRQVASALGVANVLEGTVRRDGNHVRVSTELVDARNDNTIWADSYDRDLTNIFSIQSEIAQTVASRLSAQLSPEERKDIEEKPTDNLEAYDLYLQAKQLLVPNGVIALLRSDKETFSKAISLLGEATQKDSKFALAYCMTAKAHDYLYSNRVDHTPERRALGDAAVNEALRLRPDLPEVHLAVALHVYTCYRDFDRARVQIAIAARVLSNNPDLLQLAALIDRVQGRWEKATAGLEKAATLDPRNAELLTNLVWTYWCLRRYRDNDRVLDRLIDLEPDQPLFPLNKAQSAFAEKADLKGVRAAYEALPSSMKDDPEITLERVYYAMCARDFAAAREIINKSPNEEIYLAGALVPPQILALVVERVQGNHPTMEEFGGAREQLYRKVEADRTDPFLMTALALADVSLGRKEASIQEGRRAMEMLPISEDAVDGPVIAWYVAAIYAWANQSDLAFEQLNILIKMPSYRLTYGDLKTDPCLDPLRKDPRFDKLLAELAPQD